MCVWMSTIGEDIFFRVGNICRLVNLRKREKIFEKRTFS